MPLTYFENEVNAGNVAFLDSVVNESVFVGGQASLVSTGTSAVVGTGVGQIAQINGAVHGRSHGITFEGDDSRIFIGEGGSATSGSAYSYFSGIRMDGDNSQIFNADFVGGSNGIFTYNFGSQITNYGTIQGSKTADTLWETFAVGMLTRPNPEEDVFNRIENHGTISSPGSAIEADEQLSESNNTIYGSSETTVINSGDIIGDIKLGALDDTVVNSGYISGHIYMGADDDVYHGEEGHLEFGSRIYMGSGDDEVEGGAGRERVYDGSGDDKIELGAGRDYVRVGGGADTYDGGEGKDYISYYDSSGGIRIDLRDDEISRSWGVNDVISNFESASGSKTGSDVMLGTDGSNTLQGYGGNDKFYGRGGNDKLVGGDGQDYFDGGAGTDVLYGGDDSDTFHFDFGEGKDIIKDFENNVDVIQLDNFGISKAEAFEFADESGDDVVFDFGDAGMLIIEEVTINQLQNDVFMV